MACERKLFTRRKQSYCGNKRKHNIKYFQYKVLSLTLPNIILQRNLIWKSHNKFLCHKNNVCCQNINENITRYFIRSSPALDLLCQVRACMSIYKMYALHFNLSTYVHSKVIISIQYVQGKCASRLFAKNLNGYNVHLFGQNV